MTSIIKVDTIQTSAGATPTASSLGISGVGKIGQVIYGNYNTQVSHTTTSYTDTGLSASITPSSTSSKVLVLVSQMLYVPDGVSSSTSGAIRINSNITSGLIAIGSILARYPATDRQQSQVPMYYLDSPSTTSATTYSTQVKLQAGARIDSQHNSEMSMITLMEVLA